MTGTTHDAVRQQQDNSPPLTAERLLTPGEVADLFRVDVKSVGRWANSGALASVRTPGGRRRFRTADVAALLNGGQS